MRGFWALPAILRVALASQHVFSVQDDVLAYPQYEVIYNDDYLTESQAQSQLLSKQSKKIHVESSETDVAINDANSHDNFKNPKGDVVEYQYEQMLLGEQSYLCRIPIVNVTNGRPDSNQTLSKQDQEKELIRANDRGWELLQGMQGNCIFFWSGWWSYKYCYGQGVKQFHQLPPSQGIPAFPPVEDPGVKGFDLGSVEESLSQNEKGLAATKPTEATKALGTLETRGENRYLVQRLDGGTKCDLTGKPRHIDVQFHCDPSSSDKISAIKEVTTCSYLMIIKTPRLCNDVAFLPPQKDKPNTISCSPVIPEVEISSFEKKVKDSANSQPVGDKFENPGQEGKSKPPPSIGGNVVGAHKLLSKDEHIQKSVIVGGGKETYIETIADSFGNMMSAEQLKKRGFGSAKNVEDLKRDLEELADGKGWKLEVFDTPNGREYRGVLLDSEDEKEEVENKDGESTSEKEDNAGEGDAEIGSEETYKDEL